MFRVDTHSNRIIKLEAVRFSELGFGEREHLQEWIANQPDALGEDLLIVQKEFAGFDDTKERLDLLAIDKNGTLVIVENKLDDSGRDVVWQGLKYASYCSTLSKTNIANIYQQYLDKAGKGGNAQQRICEFLDQEDFEEVKINVGSNQRLILVAAQFRKEVTSTVLWLLKHNVDVKCFRATPFKYADQVLLTLDQVIPLADAEELMIGMSEKEAEETSTERVDAARHVLRLAFWREMLDALERAHFDLYSNVSPSRDHWLNAGSGLSGVHYSMIFSQSEARVEFSLSSSSKDTNKARFDYLYARREVLEKIFGATFDWRRLDEYKVSMAVYAKPFDGYSRESWPAMIEWLTAHIRLLKAAFEPEIDKLRQVRVPTSAERKAGDI